MQTIVRESIVDALRRTKHKLPWLRLAFVLLGISFGLSVAGMMYYALSGFLLGVVLTHVGIGIIFSLISAFAENTESKTYMRICNIFILLMLLTFITFFILIGTYFWKGWPEFFNLILIEKVYVN